jgi:hypothetical protein
MKLLVMQFSTLSCEILGTIKYLNLFGGEVGVVGRKE